MWNWLQKIWKFLLGESTDEQTRFPVSENHRPVQARTKSIYPRERNRKPDDPSQWTEEKRRRFRFPVIPDTPQEKKRDGEEASRTGINAGLHTMQDKRDPGPDRVTRSRQMPANRQASLAGKTYTPTEFISPVYGRINPDERKQQEWAKRSTDAAPDAALLSSDDTGMAGRPHLPAQKVAAAQSAGETRRDERADQPGVATAKQATMDPPPAGKAPDHGQERLDGQEQEEEGAASGTTSQLAEPDANEAAAYPESHMAVPDADEVAEYPESHMAEPDADTAAPASDREHIPAEPRGEIGENAFGELWAGTEGQTAASAAAMTEALEAGRREEESQGWNGQAGYTYPTLELLNMPQTAPEDDDGESTLEQKRLLEETLANFHVQAQVVGIVKGPSVTRFELQPAPGVKVNKITSLADDIKLNLAAKDIRIEAPIPGRNAVGIEVPNVKSHPVLIRQVIGSDAFLRHPSPLAVALGMDIGGEPIVADIKKMPHGLIAGATGSGKSVCINSMIVSLLYKASPDQVRLLLIDPKMVELAPYNHLPHLVTPVVTDAKQATAALKWAVEEMERRYALFVEAGVRDIDRYNHVVSDPLPYIVIVIDELADLMMVSPQDVEDSIIRIAQKARACGIHLLLATQRPSVDVITGNIKANVPTRLAFAVFSQIDSRTILDQSGAERLLGRGDMLFMESGAAAVRLQGNFVSDEEIERVTEMIKAGRKPDYLFSREELERSVQSYDMGEDPLYLEALVYVAEQGQASASGLQRRFRIGYNRAARLIEMMEADGYVAGQNGGKPRAVLISAEEAKALGEG